MKLVSAQDAEIGKRLRNFRNQKEISQTALGKAIGVTFQQVQKYEKGTNRISGSRLVDAATFLGVPVKSLLGDADPETGKETALRDWFAGQALAGMLAMPDGVNGNFHNNCGEAFIGPAEYAYKMADAMLAARESSQ